MLTSRGGVAPWITLPFHRPSVDSFSTSGSLAQKEGQIMSEDGDQPDLPAPTRLQRRIVDAACDIADIETENPEFLHAVLCQCGLPRSRPKERIFERHSGHASLRLEAGALSVAHGKWIEY